MKELETQRLYFEMSDLTKKKICKIDARELETAVKYIIWG